MTIIKTATAIVVSLGIPVLAMVDPSERPAGGSAGSIPERIEAPQAPAPPLVEPAPNPTAAAFAAAISRLSDEADGVDRLWQAYRAQCYGPSQKSGYNGFGREWFEILDAPAGRPPSAECGDMRELISQTGAGVRDDVRRAVLAARQGQLDRGTEVGMLRWNSLELQ